MKNNEASGAMPDEFDRLLGALHGLPDVAHTKPSTLRIVTPLIGASEVFIIQTYRQREKGDTIFLERVGKEGTIRIAIPPKVADAIARQRETLTAAVRSKIGREQARARRDAGLVPFQKKKPA